MKFARWRDTLIALEEFIQGLKALLKSSSQNRTDCSAAKASVEMQRVKERTAVCTLQNQATSDGSKTALFVGTWMDGLKPSPLKRCLEQVFYWRSEEQKRQIPCGSGSRKGKGRLYATAVLLQSKIARSSRSSSMRCSV